MPATSAKSRARNTPGLASLPEPKVERDTRDEDLDIYHEEPGPRPPLKRQQPRGSKQRKEKGTALDAMLDEPVVFGDAEVSEKKVEDRLANLRAKLHGKQAEAKSARSTAAVLVAKATAASQWPKKRKSKSSVLGQLKRALSAGGGRGGGERDRSEEDSEDADDDGMDDEAVQANWQVKRRRLRNMSEDKPGKLLMLALQGFHEQLGMTIGEETKDPLSPIMVRYVPSMVMPSFPGKLNGGEKYRELLLKGKVESEGDVMVQRFKSLVMGLRDGTEKFGHYLELIPDEDLGLSSEETYFAREMAVKAAKSEALLKG